MRFLRRFPGWTGIIFGVVLFAALAKLTGWLLGPVTCRDGWQSASIGHRGACSWHGGVDRSRDILFFIYMGISGFAGWRVFDRLESRPAPPASTPIVYQRCPKCRGSMHYDRENLGVIRCDRYPVCGGEHLAIEHQRPAVSFSEDRCPNCGSSMRLRRAGRGRHAGRQFWGCAQFPRCRGTRAYKPKEQEQDNDTSHL